MRTDKAVQLIQSLDHNKVIKYEAYFNALKPHSQSEVLRRWLFAYASVHTTWEYNVKLYNNLKDLEWVGNERMLLERITASKAGLQNNRTKFINAFTMFFFDHPGWFMRSPWEGWRDYRNRLMEYTPGLGIAKTSFALELVHFHEAGLACFDTHQLQLYGLTPKQINAKSYTLKSVRMMEQHWVETCGTFGVNPVTARWLYFDKRQNKEDSRYWSHVLENEEVAV